MPLSVQWISPARNALLLEASFQEATPGNHVVVELLGVFERLCGFGRVEDHLVVLVDQVAAVRPQAPMHPAVAVAGGVAERHSARRSVAFRGLGEFEIFVGRRRKLGEPRLLQRRDPVVLHVAAVADRDGDPLVAALAVGDRARHPAAVLLAEVIGDVGDVDAFLREQVRQRVETPEQVRSGAGIGGNRGFRLHVLVGFARDVDLHAGRLGEGIDQRHEGVVLGLHEIFPSQHGQLRAALRLPWRRLRPGLGPVEQGRTGKRAGGGERGAACDQGTAGEMVMAASSVVMR